MDDNYKLAFSGLSISNPTYSQSVSSRIKLLGERSVWTKLERVAELGDDGNYGHSGCVNAVSWSSDGGTLISSGDDLRICVWKPAVEERFELKSVIHTGHTNNVFSAQFLPSSTKIATCAADRQVRVFDIGLSEGEMEKKGDRQWSEVPESGACIKVLKCHKGRVKRIVTEDSPNYFLTVSEDRTVRQHDLRTPHTCPDCPTPLIRLPHSLSTIALSSLTPYYFAVAGSSPYAHLFDRRMIPRMLKSEWGVSAEDSEDLVTCVRRFGRTGPGQFEPPGSEHVTGARLSESNGHELLLSYSGDGIHLYSIHDEPIDSTRSSSVITPNRKRRKLSGGRAVSTSEDAPKDAAKNEEVALPRTMSFQRKMDPWKGAIKIEDSEQPTVEDKRRSPSEGESDGEVDDEVEPLNQPENRSREKTPPSDVGMLPSPIQNGRTDLEASDDAELALLEEILKHEERMQAGHDGVEPDIVMSEDAELSDLEELLNRREVSHDGDEEVEDDDDGDGDDDVGGDGEDADGDDDDDEDSELEEDVEDYGRKQFHLTPQTLDREVVFSRKRFVGACNVDTVKDVNFLGPRDEFVVSGSDDGNWFMWDKTTGELAGIWEGDGSVVNVIEAHPFLPTVAVSGIDNTVKLFESSPEPTGFSRLSDAEQITEQNSRPERTTRYNLQMLALLQYGIRAQILPPTTQADDCRIM